MADLPGVALCRLLVCPWYLCHWTWILCQKNGLLLLLIALTVKIPLLLHVDTDQKPVVLPPYLELAGRNHGSCERKLDALEVRWCAEQGFDKRTRNVS